MFDVKHKGVIDFSDFVRSLNVFHPNASQEVKIDCKLNIYYVMIFNCINWSCHCILHDPLHFILLSANFYCLEFLAVSFKLYDLDNTGFIERQEV
jgi:Ca2+-binding EF-hand superfamily protein